jgi:hypothetical protein
LAKQFDNVSQACKILGCSRISFYCFTELYDKRRDPAARREPTPTASRHGSLA